MFVRFVRIILFIIFSADNGDPFAFSSITSKFTQSVGSCMGFIVPILVILFSSFFNLYFIPKGTFLGEFIIGFTVGSTVM